jgi:hypothetical protein
VIVVSHILLPGKKDWGDENLSNSKISPDWFGSAGARQRCPPGSEMADVFKEAPPRFFKKIFSRSLTTTAPHGRPEVWKV